VVPAAALPFKQDVRDYLDYLMHQAEKAPARVLLNTEATKALLDAEKYDAIIVAVGAEPVVPRVPGIDRPHVHWAPDVDMGIVEAGEKTVIVGAGSVGVESAVALKREGKDVTIIEMAPDMSGLMSSAGGAAGMELMRMIDELQVPVHLGCKLEEVTDTGVVARDVKTGAKLELPADTVLLAVGMKSRWDVADALRRSAPETEVFVVGDALEAGSIASATRTAFKAAAYI
jgi:pyruvate/2-oxoglutarate dehydrogenase complex dihydrolipoamide dehydrogenase (E3) component